MSLLGILLKKGIFIIISDNPWILGIGVVIFIISVANRFLPSESNNNNEYEKPKVTKYTLCKACTKKKFDMKTGIYCGETGQKPNFEGMCNQFVPAQK